ncbi:MAG: ATP-binding protein [Thermoguttaceae bacterium]|jgi:PAS domain S-box-containing protein
MNDKTSNRIWKWSMIGLFGVAALALPAGGYWLYRHQTQAIRSEKQSNLKAIAELKANQIAAWRSERLADALVSSKTAGFRAAVGHWLQASGDASSRNAIHEDMELLRKSYAYGNVILAATDGRILLSLDSHLIVLDAGAKELVAQAVSSCDTVFGDLFRCPSCSEVHLDVAAPILDPDNRPVAVLILRIDAKDFLYPFIQSWPTPSRSAETLLMRRDGDDALFLNNLRHRPDPAMTLRIPLSRSDLPSVQAALGKTGSFAGRDYRGVEVLAEILPVPGTPWFMVAKVDVDEILAEARYRGQFILLFIALSMLVTGAMAAFVFSFRQKTLYQNLYHAERQRRQVEEEIRATFYSIGDGVISTDAAGRVTRMNPVAEQLTGWDEAEALGKPSEQVFHIVNEETRAEVESPVARVMRDGVIMNLANHTLLLSRDGSERPIADSGAPICSEHGRITGVVLVFRDQSEDRRSETSLRQSEERYRIIFESSSDAVMTLAPPSWKFTHGNPAAVKMFGVKDEAEFTTLGPWQVSPEVQPDGRPSAEKAMEMLETAMRKGSHFFEWTHRRLNGEDFPTTVLLTRMELAGQALLQATVRDISEWKNARDREARSLGRLEGVNQLREDLLLPGSPEEKFKRITEAAVRLLDLDFCRIWSVKPSDLCNAGCIHAEVTEGPHACRDREKCLHLVASSGRYTHIDGDHRRVPLGAYKIGRIASGQDKSFLTNDVTTDPLIHNHDWAKSLGLASFAGYKLRDGNGKPIGVLAAFAKYPISEEDDAFLCNLAETTSKVIRDAEVQAELREKTKQALLASRAKSEFLANMSHEIRTPMTSILGYMDLLMDDSLSAADRKTFLTTMRCNAEHLLQLINDILDLSKIESGKMEMDLGPCHLPSMVADVAGMMRPRAEERKSTLEIRYTGQLPETIRTDGARLRQVIVNLVGNAVKFTENGSIRIGVLFLPQWRPDQSAVSMEVTDTGIGIRQEAMTHLFEPFTQAERSTNWKYGGTGLGLAISRQIVTALGGELSVQSLPGEGSTFTVTIPTGDLSGVNLLESPGEIICENEAGTRWTPGAGVLRGVKILLAEDSIDIQKLVRAVLGKAGAEVEVAENGRLAIERAETGIFDVMLMDMNMPEMDGYEATRRLRDRGYQRPILALTANAMSGDCEHCLEAGCDAHLAKPIDRKHLIETVAQYAMSKTSQTEAPADWSSGGPNPW